MNSAPPKLSPPVTRVAAVLIAVTVTGIAAVVYFFNPASHGFYPVCQFHRLTGLNCPGCGGTRALYALLHGEVARALRDNALAVVGFVALLLRCGWFGLNELRGRPNGRFFPPHLTWPLLVAVVVFGVLRNLPAFSFLSP